METFVTFVGTVNAVGTDLLLVVHLTKQPTGLPMYIGWLESLVSCCLGPPHCACCVVDVITPGKCGCHLLFFQESME